MTIDYYFSDTPNGRDIPRMGMACFSECSEASCIRGKYITYVLRKEALKVTDEEMYKYLLFLRVIPEFRPWLKYPKKLVESKEICFSCEEKNVGVFLGLTLFRAIEEFPTFVKEIAALKLTGYELSNLGILRLFSNKKLITNNNHWIIGNIQNVSKEVLEKPVNVKLLETSRPFKQGNERKLYKFMNYDPTAEGLFNYKVHSNHVEEFEKWKKDNTQTEGKK